MSIFRLSASVVSRGNTGLASTKSAVAAAAYNARAALFDERQGVLRDVTADAADLIRADILLPANAPVRWLDREILWNEVERVERRVDAQLARAIVLTLPRDLTLHENVNLARDFFSKSFVARGMVADVAVHDKRASDGLPQPHAHALLTMRQVIDGAFGMKERAWNTAATLQQWRETWAEMANQKLAARGAAPITHQARQKEWVRVFVQAIAVPRNAVRSHFDRESARARYLMEASRPVIIAAWRRAKDWIERRREPMAQQDAVDQLREALWKRGLRPAGDPIMDGKWHRVAAEGDRGAKMSGSYVAHGDGRPNGYIQNYKTGEGAPWRADGNFISDPVKLQAAQAERRIARENDEKDASSRSASQWIRAVPAREHPYLDRKDVTGDGARQTARGDLLIPMRDADGKMWGVQTITPSGDKFFPKGGRVIGTHALLGELRAGEPVIVVEGWATAKTVHAETGRAVVAAFNASNIEHVARAYRDKGHPVTIGSDNDHGLPLRNPPLPNVGLEKGAAAASAVGGKAIVPAFAMVDAGTDWNDYARLHGAGAVRRAFEREGIPMSDTKPAVVAQTETTQAQRDAARQMVPVLAQAAMNADAQAHQASMRAQYDAQRAHQAATL